VLYAVFLVAAVALLAAPGPAVLNVVWQSIEGRRRAGLVSRAGIHCGTLVHVGAAALGLSSLLVPSARAFEAVKYAGAAGLSFAMLGPVSDGAYALLAGALAGRLRPSRRAGSAGRRVSSGVLVTLGVTAALAGPSRSA
jgi:threonine/homoserine/homoserine lactone efflux protein